MSTLLSTPLAGALRTAASIALGTGLLCLPAAFPGAGQALAEDSFGPALSREASRPIAQPRFKSQDTRTRPSADKACPRSFTMGEAVRFAMEHNETLGASEAQMRASEEGRKAQRGYLGPKLGTTYSWLKQTRTTSVQNAQQPPSNGTFSWSLEVSQVLFDGFKNLGAYQKQALQAESDRASLRRSELETTGAVQEQFIDYLSRLELIHSQREAEARLQDQLKITKAFHDAGLKPKLDVLQAEVDLGKASQTLIASENQRDTTRARLNTLLGLPAQKPVQYQGGLRVAKFTGTLESCLERAYRLRPDLYVGCKAVEMAVKDRLLARSGYYPRVEAYYNITKTGNTPDLERGGSRSSRSTTWEVGARLSWDLFQWGTTYFADQQAGWLVAKMRSQMRQIILDAGYEVKSRFLALREADKRIAVAKASVASASEAYEAALGAYQAQVGTNFDVLDASRKLLTAQADLTAAKGDYLKALSKLYLAMGEYRPDLL
ncbi:MAG: TolC family protein [Desulfovibrio sp.]|nr:TolC family protein [Desulfovibrio sp.]